VTLYNATVATHLPVTALSVAPRPPIEAGTSIVFFAVDEPVCCPTASLSSSGSSFCSHSDVRPSIDFVLTDVLSTSLIFSNQVRVQLLTSRRILVADRRLRHWHWHTGTNNKSLFTPNVYGPKLPGMLHGDWNVHGTVE
jgi:hypothetical protein